MENEPDHIRENRTYKIPYRLYVNRYSLICFFLILALGCSHHKYTNSYIESSIIGTWSIVEDSEPSVFRFVRTDSFETLRRGFHFFSDGSLTQYGPWGCQMPPYFKTSNGRWEVDKEGRVVIHITQLGNASAHWTIVSLKRNELRFTTDLVL
jgi:hypothetical protein